MKRFLSIFLAAAALFLFSGCGSASEKSPVLPPTRTGEGSLQGSLATKYTFETAFSSADVVARIQVGDWLGEEAELYRTYYQATVLECFKGDLSGTFTLLQDGCSRGTHRNYPLFTSGNEMLVFLYEATGSDIDEVTVVDDDTLYWIIGAYTTIMDVVSDEAGNRYYGDRYGVLSETIRNVPNYAENEAVSQSVFACLSAADPLVKTPYTYLYAEEDILSLLRSQ